MKTLPLPQGKHYVGGTVIAVLAVAAFWIVWFIGATKYQSAVDQWIAKGREAGYDISFDRREQFGFPRRTVLRFTNVHWKNTDGVEFHTGDLDISAELWQTRNFIAKFKGQAEIDMPTEAANYTLVLGGEGGDAKVKLSDDGSWQACTITMNNVRVGRAPDFIFLTDALHLSTQRPDEEPIDNKTAGLTLAASADNVTLPAAMPPSFGAKMPKLEVALRLLGPVPDFRRKESVANWNKINGTVDFDHLNLEWGPLLINAEGTMGFDDDLQPEGAFKAVLGHQDAVMQSLTKGGYIAASQQEMFSSAMRLFAKPAPIKDVTGIELPIAVQLGGFFLGPIRIFAYPPIEWE